MLLWAFYTTAPEGLFCFILRPCECVFVFHFQVRSSLLLKIAAYHLPIFTARDSHEIRFPEGFTVLKVFSQEVENMSERKTEQLLQIEKALSHRADFKELVQTNTDNR